MIAGDLLIRRTSGGAECGKAARSDLGEQRLMAALLDRTLFGLLVGLIRWDRRVRRWNFLRLESVSGQALDRDS